MMSYQTYSAKTNYNSRNFSTSYSSKRTVKHFSYSPLDRIGKGYSSIVYKGINQQTNQIVAIKAVDMKGVKDAISREMLDCEIEALKTLDHENILKCFDVVRDIQYCYIITEFCNQGDVSGVLKKKRKLPESQTLKILKDVVAGFIEIGKKGFLHRDLKLANILLKDDKAKIADFGFAKKRRLGSEKEKYNVGSPLYMSPQALKKNIYSLKNDVWSIGIMTYELLHGQTPWECRTEKELLDKMTRIPIKFRESLKLSSGIKKFISKCLEVDEEKRMSLEDLEIWLQTSKTEGSDSAEEPPTLNCLSNLNVAHKINSQIQKGRPSSQLTRRLSENNPNPKDISLANKENTSGRPSTSARISKTLVQKNNSILVNQINTFRLLFKMLEKIKKNFPDQANLLTTISDEVIKRVTSLKKCCDDKSSDYGLKQTLSYFDERSNPTIKKYKSVIGEYFKKYTTQLGTNPSKSTQNLKEMIRGFLESCGKKLQTSEQLMLGYWMVEFLLVSKETTKDQLDSIIEPKLKLTQSYIWQRIKELI